MPQSAVDSSVVKGAINHHPTYRNRVSLVLATIHVKGLRAGVSHYSQRLIQLLTNRYGKPANDEPDAADGRFVPERNNERLEYLAIQSPNVKWGLPYAPWSPELFDRAIRAWPCEHPIMTLSTLARGRACRCFWHPSIRSKALQASIFANIGGCGTHEIAAHQKQNGSRVRIQCVYGDAAEFQFPNEPTVVYLFNPFQGKVMDRVIANLETSLRDVPRDLWVIYANPWEGRKFRRSAMFETIEWNLEYSIHRSILR